MSEIRFKIIDKTEPKKIPRFSRENALLLYLIAAVGLVAVSLLGSLLPMPENMNPHVQMLLMNALYYLPFLMLPLFLSLKRRPDCLESLHPNPISLFTVIMIGMMAVLGVFLVNDIVVLWCIPFQKLGFNINAVSMPVPTTRRELVISIVTTAVLPGVCEEFLFRGAIMSALEKEGTKRAVIGTSLLFMLLHGSITGAPSQFLLGLIIAELVICCDSVYAGLIYHTVHNAVLMILEYMQNRLPGAAEQSGDLLTAIGGIGGAALLLVEIVFLGMMMLFTLRIFRMRGWVHGIMQTKGEKEKLRGTEIALLAAGLVITLILYVTDIRVMLLQ